MEFENICKEIGCVKMDSSVLLDGRELEYIPNFRNMRKQLEKGEKLAAYFIFQDIAEDTAMWVDTDEQFDVIAGLLDKDTQSLELYMNGLGNKSDIVFREVIFFGV